MIANGTITATGGESAHDIGAGANTEIAGDGTRIIGGSVHCVGSTALTPAASNATEQVYCVTVTNLVPNAAVTISGLNGYGTDGIFADADGKVYLWLPNGTHYFSIGDTRWRVTVVNEDRMAILDTVPDELEITDITVTETTVELTVSTVPPTWLIWNSDVLCVRATAELPFPEGADGLLSGVTTTPNADGTVTLTIPRSGTALHMFYRVEVTSRSAPVTSD